MKMKNNILDIPAAAAAIFVNPNSAETIAIAKKIKAHFRIFIFTPFHLGISNLPKAIGVYSRQTDHWPSSFVISALVLLYVSLSSSIATSKAS